MAAFFGAKTRPGRPLKDDEVALLLADGNNSEIEEFTEDDDDFVPQVLDHLDESGSSSDDEHPDVDEAPSPIPTTSRSRGGSTRGRSSSTRGRGRVRGRGQSNGRRGTGQRVWVETVYVDKSHDYTSLPINQVRSPIDYVRDYFDDSFLEEAAKCTNLYHLRKTGNELKTSRLEIAKLFALHIIMGCIPYPRLSMYWKTETRLAIVADTMTRDRFLTLRNSLHVVDSDDPPEAEKDNALWKVQPMIKKVKDTCIKLERVPGYYSIDEQMIPFTGRCKLRQVVKNKPRPVGLKNFVLTTSEGLMLDFSIYKGAKTMFCDTTLGLGPSVILHLSQSIPPGSCVFHDRYFTTIPLAEEMLKRNLHSTGTIMVNRIPDRSTIDFKTDSRMARGETQQFVCNDIVIDKWKDNKSVTMASNCTGVGEATHVRRWDKNTKTYVEISAPTVVERYNQKMGGVDVLDQQIEYYRTFIKTRKWTLKVLVHFIDLACANAWRLYKNDCTANGYRRKDTLPLLDFRLEVAECLKCLPETERREDEPEPQQGQRRQPLKIYKPVNMPSTAKRHDGYDHLAVFDDIKAPRTCRMKNCGSRSKIKCEKCDVYHCLSRDKNCFKAFHKL